MLITKKDAIDFLNAAEININDADKIKLLDQDERAFILTAVKASKKDTFITLSGQFLEFEETDAESVALKERIINKLSSEAKPKPSGFFAAFFKGLGNAFFGRLSSDKVYKAIKER